MPSSTTDAPVVEDPGSAASTRAGSGSRRLGLLLRALPVAFVMVLGWTHRWVEEDAFINFRVVDQIRAGHGPVFNIGQRVEVATSPLWLATLTVGRTVLPFARIEHLSIVVGLVLTGLGLWWVQAGATKLWRRSDATISSALVVPLGVLVIAALPPTWVWATSGLENGLSVAWLGAVMLVLATLACSDTTTRPRLVGAAFVLGIGPLVRPDLTIISAVAIV